MSPKTIKTLLHRHVQESPVSKGLVRYLKEEAGLKNMKDSLVVNTSSSLALIGEVLRNGYSERGLQSIINLARINDIRHINKFFESVNESLEPGGYFAGTVEPTHLREKRKLPGIPAPFKKTYLFFDYLLNRVWPKLPWFRRFYFFLTRGRNRVVSEMETYGRLYSCGFRLVHFREMDGMLQFIARKVKAPEYNKQATYGPIIKLRRVGKNGKLVNVYKLRTMSPYSEYVQQLIYEWNGVGNGNGAKFTDDPRITAVGRFMRRYWLDELPMLYNLARGDLKLFGVRPISPHYFSLYPQEFQEFRKKFKPGLIPPVYVEIPKTVEDAVDIERRYLEAYEKSPFRTDLQYTFKALYNIFFKRTRSN